MSDDDDEFKIISIGLNKLFNRGGGSGYARGPKGLKPVDEFQKTHPSLQDKISNDVKLFHAKIDNFEAIAEKDYADISLGTFIRYVTYDKDGHPKLRLGGFLVNNKAPQYWVLRSGSRGKKHITWSVNLQATPRNLMLKRKGVPTKSEEDVHAREALEALSSGKYHLVPRSLLQELTGGTNGTNTGKFNLVDDYDEGVEDEIDDVDYDRPKVRVNFTE
jgi:hypothetical protein